MAEAKEKTGVFTGAYAINPVNDEQIPIYIADYVLMGYGTGAIMAVPAHDERDFEFAKKFDLPIRAVVLPDDEWLADNRPHHRHRLRHDAEPLPTCYTAQRRRLRERPSPATDIAINSGPLDGLPTAEAKEQIIDGLEDEGTGHRSINYKLRDWLFSRQRYWGEPFPILLDDDGTGRIALDEAELPVHAAGDGRFQARPARPEPPLARRTRLARRSTSATAEARSRRETNTMPQWAGSCWYYLRYIDPHNDKRFVDPEKEAYWMPVDLYVGGVEHAVLHLLYSRFWHKVLFDLGHVSTPEPFQRLVNQGMILGETEYHVFEADDGSMVSASEVRDVDEEAAEDGVCMIARHGKTGQKLVGEG